MMTVRIFTIHSAPGLTSEHNLNRRLAANEYRRTPHPHLGARISEGAQLMSATTDFLIKNGWRQIGTQKQRDGYGNTVYWDHPDHQPDWAGAFMTMQAERHQKQVDKNGWCDCISERRGAK